MYERYVAHPRHVGRRGGGRPIQRGWVVLDRRTGIYVAGWWRTIHPAQVRASALNQKETRA